MQHLRLVARLGGQHVLGDGGQGRVGHRLAREHPGVGRADPVAVERRGQVDQHDVRDVGGPGVGHRAGDGGVQRPQHHLGGGVGRARVVLQPGADQVGVQRGRRGATADLRRARDGLVVVEDDHPRRVGGHRLDGPGQAGPHVGQLGRQRRRDGTVHHALRPDIEIGAEHRHAGQLVLQAGGEADVVGAVLEEHQPGGMLRQVGRRDLVTEVARRPGRVRALPVGARVVRRVGHRPADGQLVAGQVAVGRPHGHGQAEGGRHAARVGERRRSLRHPARGQAHLRGAVGVVQAVPVGDRVAQRDGAGRRGGRGGSRGRGPGGENGPAGTGGDQERAPRRRPPPRPDGTGERRRARCAAFP